MNHGETCDRQLGFPPSPTSAQNAHSSVKLCFSFSVIECSYALQNETLLLSLKYFMLPKIFCILQTPIRLVMLLRSFYICITGIFVSSCKQTSTIHWRSNPMFVTLSLAQTHHEHHQSQAVQDLAYFTLKKLALQSFKSSGTAHPSTHCHIPTDLNVQRHRCENLKPHEYSYWPNTLTHASSRTKCFFCPIFQGWPLPRSLITELK